MPEHLPEQAMANDAQDVFDIQLADHRMVFGRVTGQAPDKTIIQRPCVACQCGVRLIGDPTPLGGQLMILHARMHRLEAAVGLYVITTGQ